MPNLQTGKGSNVLFVAPFDVVINDFGKVIEGVNRRFGTKCSALPHDESTVSECFSRIENGAPVKPDGCLDESVVNRPSRYRAKLKPTLLEDLRNSRRMLRKLEEAHELYTTFCQAPGRAQLCQEPQPAPLQ